MTLKSPYPWFGGKSAVAAEIWRRLGQPDAFVDPFLGSAALILGRPNYNPNRHIEIVNDLDGMIVNFWRAVQRDPQAVAHYADNPIFESDMHARHIWLVTRKPDITARLEADPDFFDAKAAGWWVWGQSVWLGGGWCSGKGPWHVADGRLVRSDADGVGISRKRPNVTGRDKGVARKTLRTSGEAGIRRRIPNVTGRDKGVARKTLRTSGEEGVRRQIPNISETGCGVMRKTLRTSGEEQALVTYLVALSERFRHVRVVCGSWERLLVPAIVEGLNEQLVEKPRLTGVVLDPPYLPIDRESRIYTHDSPDVAMEARAWALAHGDNPSVRIALCGYEGHFDMPDTWSVFRWRTNGGFANLGNRQGRANKAREAIWFSPSCLPPDTKPIQFSLFDFGDNHVQR